MNQTYKQAFEEDSKQDEDVGSFDEGDTAVARVYDYRVMQSADSEYMIHFQVWFCITDDQHALYSADHGPYNQDPNIAQLLEGNEDNIWATVGDEYEVIKTGEDSWRVTEGNLDIEFDGTQEESNLGVWGTKSQSPSRVQEVYDECFKESPDSRVDTAEIVDFYAKEAPSCFEQELEMGIFFELPDGRPQSYQFLHGPEHPDTLFEKLMSYVGADNLYELSGEEIPIYYDTSEGEWRIHLRHWSVITRKLADFGLMEPNESRLDSFGRTYGHQPDRNHVKRPVSEERLDAILRTGARGS